MFILYGRITSGLFILLIVAAFMNSIAAPPASRQWEKISEFCDEFDGNMLNTDKWFNYNPNWTTGRPPGYFNSANVRVEDGYLNLFCTDNFDGSYYTATIRSIDYIRYGYFEAHMKAHRSSCVSAFWFYNQSPPQDDPSFSPRWTEIDVVECGGNATAPFKQDSTIWQTVHLFDPHEVDYRTSTVPFVTWEDYHTYAVLWTPDTIAFFCDDVFTWGRSNTAWKFPLHMLFDCEIFISPECDPEGFGVPNSADLPSHMSVDWVRAWKDMGPVSVKQQEYAQMEKSKNFKDAEYAVYDIRGREIGVAGKLDAKQGSGVFFFKNGKGAFGRIVKR